MAIIGLSTIGEGDGEDCVDNTLVSSELACKLSDAARRDVEEL